MDSSQHTSGIGAALSGDDREISDVLQVVVLHAFAVLQERFRDRMVAEKKEFLTGPRLRDFAMRAFLPHLMAALSSFSWLLFHSWYSSVDLLKLTC